MAALVILALLCVSPVLANSEPKDEACAEGEDYWCQNLRTAIECEAVQHCVQTTWSQPTAENDICDVCKKFIAQVADLVKDKSLQDAVKDALHKGCALIPIKEFADQCNDYVDSYLPLIIQFIENELDPSVVCVALGLCKSQQPIQAHEILSNAIPEDEPRVANPSRLHTAARVHQQKPLANDLPQCEFCLLLMEKLEELLPKEQTESAIIHVLDQLCSHLPSKYSAKCQNFVDTYGKTAIDLLFKQLGPHAVCIALKLCFMEAKSFVPLFKLTSGISCSECDQVVGHLRFAQMNGSDVNALLTEACNSMLGNSRVVCKDFVHSYKPQLSVLLQKSQVEKDICKELDLCIRKVEATVLGRNECTWGPSHWCKNLELATKCKMVDYCKEKFWNA